MDFSTHTCELPQQSADLAHDRAGGCQGNPHLGLLLLKDIVMKVQ